MPLVAMVLLGPPYMSPVVPPFCRAFGPCPSTPLEFGLLCDEVKIWNPGEGLDSQEGV